MTSSSRSPADTLEGKNYVSDPKIIGQGTYGTAFKVKFKGDDIVVKEAKLLGIDKKRAHDHVPYDVIGANISKLAYPEEYRYLAMVRNLIKMDASPNFALAYDIGFCDSCRMASKECYATFMELADGDLFKVELNEPYLVTSIIRQLLLALQSMQTTYGLIHGDIKRNNILFKRVQPGGYFKYTVENSLMKETFYVKNMGIIPMITDFGLSRSVHPNYSQDGNWGTRIGKLYKTGDGDIGFEAIYDNNYRASPLIHWKGLDFSVSTKNKVYRGKDISGFRPRLDPYDLVQFPAEEFFKDIMDVLHIFNGGLSMAHPGYKIHNIPEGIPKPILDTLNSIDKFTVFKQDEYGDEIMETPKNKNIKFFLSAVNMLKVLYNGPENIDRIVASFLTT